MTLKEGSGVSGTSLGSITSATFSNCGWVLSSTATVTPSGLPWHLNAQQYDSATGVTHGTITGIDLKIVASGFCNATVDGTAAGADNGLVDFIYHNSTHELEILITGGNLHFYNVLNCYGLVKSSDSAAFSTTDPAKSPVTYTVTPAQTITSP